MARIPVNHDCNFRMPPIRMGLLLASLCLGFFGAGCDWSRFYPDYDIPDVTGSDLPFDPPDDWVSSDDGLPGFVIVSAIPVNGPVSGGTRVTIEGRGFSPGSRVFFGQQEGLETIVENETSLKSTTPGGSGYSEDVDISVVRPDGKRTVMRPGFRYEALVTVERISPSGGATDGGTPIVVTGRGFAPDSDLVIDGRSALQVRRIDDSTILALTPPGDAGEVDVLVISGGTQGKLAAGFRYVPRPSGITCNPPVVEFADEGGFSVISVIGPGTGLASGVSLSTGSVVQIRPTGDDSLEITADFSTAADEGAVDVNLAGPWGSTAIRGCFAAISQGTAADGDLRIWAVHPDSATTAGGGAARLTVTGLDYGDPGALVVRLGNSASSVSAVPDQNTVEFQIIQGTPGKVDVSLESPSEQGVLMQAFTYLIDRKIDAIEPASVRPASTAQAVITGAGLADAVEVMIGPLPAPIQGKPSNESISIMLPPLEAGVFDLIVRMSDGSSHGLASALTVAGDRPSVKSIAPDRGSIAGGTFAWLTGSGLKPGTRVFFGNNEATILADDDPGRMPILSPRADAEGPVDVFVVGADGIRQRLDHGFNYFNPAGYFGGVWGNTISGAVNVTVLDSYTDEPVPDAFVILGSQSDTPYKGYTDGRGMVTLSGRRLKGPVVMTATRQDYTTYTIAGSSAENMTVFLEPLFKEIPDGGGEGGETVFPLGPGMITGIVTGADKEFIAPPSSCEGMPLVNGPICQTCQADGQCGNGAVCVLSGPTALTCSVPCDDRDDCPDDYDCYQTDAQGPVCKPSPGIPEIRCAVSDSSSSRWSDPFGPGSIADEAGRWALSSRLGDVAVFCLGGYLDGADGNYVPVVMGLNRNLQVQSATVNGGNVVRLEIPLSRTLRTRMLSAPDGTDGPGIHTAYLTLSLGSDGYLNLWTPISVTNGSVFDFERLPRDLTGPLAGTSFIVSTEATSPNSSGEPYSAVDPQIWTPARPSPLEVFGAQISAPEIETGLDVLAGCSAGGRGVVIDSVRSAWLIDRDGIISALPAVGNGDINGCAWLPDGTVMFFGDRSTVRTFNPETLQQTSEFVSMLPHRLVAAAVAADGTVWAASRNRLFFRGPDHQWTAVKSGSPAAINDLAASPDGTIVGVGDRGLVFTLDGSTVLVHNPVTNEDLHSVAFFAETMAVSGTRGTILKGPAPDSLTVVDTGLVDELTCIREDSTGGFVVAGTRGIVVRLTDDGATVIRNPVDDNEISAVVPVGEPDGTGFSRMLLFRRDAVMTGPFLNVIRFQSPPANWLWLDRTLRWTIETPPVPSFYYFRMYTVGLTGRWSILAAGDLGTLELPDIAAASESGTSPLKSGNVSLKAYAVDATGFDMNNYDSSSMYTSQWRAWSTQGLLTKLTSAF